MAPLVIAQARIDESDQRPPSIRVFGGVSVVAAGEPVDIGGPRQRRLLALLSIRAGSLVDVDWLAEYLWEDHERPEAPTPSLRTSVYRLRASLPPEARAWIETEPDGYRLAAPDDAVEQRRFAALRALAASARQNGDPATALGSLDEALALWRGDPFRELEDLEWAFAEIERLRMDRLEMMEERWEAALALGRHTQIVGELAAFNIEHGDRDRSVRQYALALHRAGRTAEGLKAIATHKKILVEEYGLDPSPALIELEQALLAGDPSLLIEAGSRPLRGYRLLDEIGVGAFSVVWRASQPSVGREVAIKQIRAELANQPAFIRRFEAEAHLVARLEHPHIVPLIDYWRDPDSAYLVMRLLRGGTLEQRLQDGPLTLQDTLRMARQIGDGLSAAHAAGVIHRDVKPANILFDEQGNAFLGDFGIALEATATSPPESGRVIGTPAYASPEQTRNEAVDARADIFSFGTVLYECLSGSGSGGPLADDHDGVPAAVSDALEKARAIDFDVRFASIEDFLVALEAGEARAPVAAERATPMPSTTDVANPYLGLRAFDDADVDSFFGRERLVAELTDHLADGNESPRCLMVVGPSGSGKSSVVRAGLVPAIRDGAIDGSSDWFISTMVPGRDPYESLEAALLRIAVNPPPSLIEQLRSDERGILRGILRCLPGDDDQLVLVIDQFEELFTGRSSQDADAFLTALAVALEESSSPLQVVGTLRADYYDRPLEHPVFAPLLGPATVTVTPLTGGELERTIVEPARRLGVEYESGLAARISAETSGQTSPLPLLQYTLLELFDRRDGRMLTIAAYDEIGGLSGAIAARAESLYLDADADTQEATRRVFGSLTDPGAATADLRRRIEVASLGGAPATAAVLERFGSARLLTFDRDVSSRAPTVEVAHEALLREWPRLAAWLVEDMELLQAMDALAADTDRWQVGDYAADYLLRGGPLEEAQALAETESARLRPLDLEFLEASRKAALEAERTEHVRRRRQRLLATGVGIAAIVAMLAGGFAVLEQGRADDQAAVAAAAEQRADLVTLVRRAAEEPDAKVGLLLALEAQRRAPGRETDAVLLAALQRAGGADTIESFEPIATSSCAGVWPGWIAPNGMSQTSAIDGIAVLRDLDTGDITEHGAMPGAGCGDWYADATSGRRYSVAEGRDRLWLGPLDGPWETDIKLDGQSWVSGPAGFAGNRLLLEGPGTVRLVDAVAGTPVGVPISGLAADPLVLMRPDGRLFASASEPDEATGLTTVAIHDARDGALLTRVEIAGPATAMHFDEAADELLVASFPGRLLTIDLSSGDVVAEIDVAGEAVSGLAVRPDGGVLVTSSGPPGGWELVDRRRGPLPGKAGGLDNVVGSALRADGTVLAWNPESRLDVLDLESEPLVSRSIDLDPSDLSGPFDQLEIYDGRALVVDYGGPDDILIDLATGERAPLDLSMPDGGQLPLNSEPMLVDGGYAAVSTDLDVTLWQDGEVVAQQSIMTPDGTGLDDRTHNGSRVIVGSQRRAGGITGQLLHVGDGEIQHLVTIPGERVPWAAGTRDDGLVLVDFEGTMRTYAPDGTLADEFDTGVDMGRGSVRVATDGRGRTALSRPATQTGFSQIDVIDRAADTVQSFRTIGDVANLAFAQDGAVLVMQTKEGTVRLRDIDAGVTSGIVWQGNGAPFNEPWYDEDTDSIWVTSRDRIVQLALGREAWRERACQQAGRDLTPDEWERLVPGEEPPVPACSEGQSAPGPGL